MNHTNFTSRWSIVVPLILLIAQAVYSQPTAAAQYQNMRPKPKLLFDRWARAQNELEGKTLPARQRFESLPISRRSTFAAVTNALLYTKLTDQAGRSLGAALDLVENLESIAGQEDGKSSDEQFRLYVKLKPDALRTLDLSREFRRGKNNTIFHKGFPINYRQDGAAPTLQFSIATDEISADIDVDYRSSSFPSALFNGHLTASNSDVRASGNYLTHLRRWSGLVDWWDDVTPDLVAEFEQTRKRSPAVSQSTSGTTDTTETGLLSAEVREFFRVWLIDRNPSRAMDFIQKELTFCSNLKDPGNPSNLSARHRLLFYNTLKAANKELSRTKSLEEALLPVAPVDPFIKAVEHEQKHLYTLATITDNDYRHFVCASRTSELNARAVDERARTYGTYYVVKFRFALTNGKGGILRLLWSKENGVWKIAAFDAVTA